MDSGLVYVWLAVAGVCCVVGGMVGSAKNAQMTGAVCGLLFGPLGIVITAFLDARPQCPVCGTRLAERKGDYRLRFYPHCPACNAALDEQTGKLLAPGDVRQAVRVRPLPSAIAKPLRLLGRGWSRARQRLRL